MTPQPHPAVASRSRTAEALRRRTLLQKVAAEFGVRETAIAGPVREKRFIGPRFAFCWVAHEALDSSYGDIGKILGDRDHATIVHAVRRATEMRAADADFRERTDRLAKWVEQARHG